MGLVKKQTKVKKFLPRRLETSSLTLPTAKSVPEESMQNYSVLIYGAKKIGKTSLVAEFPRTMFLMCEPGGKALSIFQRPVRNWREFEGYIDLVIKSKDFDTIAIDTADYSYDYCLEAVCEKLVIDHPSEEEYGKGWKAVKQEYTKVISKLLHSGKGVVFISHSKDSEFKTRKNDSYHKVGSSMSGQAKEVLEGLIDIWVNYAYDGKRRYLTIQGSDEIDAGHRLQGHFNYADGTPIERIPMGNSAKEAYRNLMAAFANKLEAKNQEPEKKKIKLSLKRA